MQHIPENGTAHLKKQQRERRDCLLKTTWKNRCTAGFLAVLLGCSSLLTGASSTMAASIEQTESKEETQAEDITIKQGETFDPDSDFTGTRNMFCVRVGTGIYHWKKKSGYWKKFIFR